MGVLLQAHYRRLGNEGERITVPCPLDPATPHAPWWWDHLAAQAAELRRCGFSAILTPPVCKTQSGASSGADGYGLFDNYDIGSKPAFGHTATRFGDDERLRRAIAVMHACGLDVYTDVVMHQYDGGRDGVYQYVGADGTQLNGRFPKHASCFVGPPPRVAVDPVADPTGNFPFGDMVSYLHSTPKGYMLSGTAAAMDWLTRTLDIQGYRIDDVKGLAVQVVKTLLDERSMARRFAVGEYFDGNPQALHWWVWQSGMDGRCNVFDFTLHWAIQAMCSGADWWMGHLRGAGYIAFDPLNAVTFVENPDTDVSPGQNVIQNKLLGYALILTAEGYPCVYYRDYSTDDGCYGLKPNIDNLIWIHENLAFGPTAARLFDDPHVYAFERLGAPGLLVVLNNDPFNSYQRTVQTNFGAHAELHEYTGKYGDIWTDENGRASFRVPRNDNGHGYLCFSRPGYTQAFGLTERTTTQMFEGALDLDKAPVRNNAMTAVRVWCASGKPLRITTRLNHAGWSPSATVTVRVVDSDSRTLASTVLRSANPEAFVDCECKHSGWHTIELTGDSLPSSGAPYELEATYTAPQELQ